MLVINMSEDVVVGQSAIGFECHSSSAQAPLTRPPYMVLMMVESELALCHEFAGPSQRRQKDRFVSLVAVEPRLFGRLSTGFLAA